MSGFVFTASIAGGRPLESLRNDIEPRRIRPRPADDLEAEVAHGILAELLGDQVASIDILAGPVELADQAVLPPEEVETEASAVAHHDRMLKYRTWQPPSLRSALATTTPPGFR